MPVILQVYPRDVYIQMEFSMKELQMLRLGLNLAQINANSEIPEEWEAQKFLKDLWTFLDRFLEGEENGT